MNIVRVSWKKVLAILFVILMCLSYVLLPKIALKSWQIKKAVFKVDKSLGNYEVVEEENAGPGEKGIGHHVGEDRKKEEERLKSIYGFNQLVSDEISLDRTVPDMRESECKHWDYPEDLPTASVVFIFHNEGWSTLLRSVHSVINRSPQHLLHEVVLVDDKSELEHLHERLDEEIKKPYYQKKVKLVRNRQREGLIRARNIGAEASTGEVVVFMDAHCEVGLNWLPPLLAPIYENPTTLSVPVIDGIEWDDFSIKPVYSEGAHSRGIFEWGMLYKETALPEREALKRKYHSEPYNSPTHAGGLFAIKRSWFEKLGWYDPGLQIWGGENYELSFKLWQCGGKSVWVPCSRIGHVYRGHSCSSCHSGGVDKKWGGIPLALRNYKRLIETWFDDKYKEYFYTREPLARFIDMGDISAQVALKKRLECKSFTWFMKEIAYDVFDKYPELPPNKHWGTVKNTKTGMCMDTLGATPGTKIRTSPCHSWGGGQLWRLNTAGQLASGEWCAEYSPTSGTNDDSEVTMSWCTEGSASGNWVFDERTGLIRYTKLPPDEQCLSIHEDESSNLVFVRCDSVNELQQWKIEKIKPYWS